MEEESKEEIEDQGGKNISSQEKASEVDEESYDDNITRMDSFPSEDEIEKQIEAASTGERVSFMDPDFLLILIFAVIVDVIDIILELTSLLVVPKLIGIAIDVVVFAIIGGWMNWRGTRLSDSKKAAQAAIANGMQKQIKNLERLRKIGQIDQKVFDRYARRYSQQMGKAGTALAKAARSPAGRTIIKSGLAFLGEIIVFVGIIPFWTISVLSTLREK